MEENRPITPKPITPETEEKSVQPHDYLNLLKTGLEVDGIKNVKLFTAKGYLPYFKITAGKRELLALSKVLEENKTLGFNVSYDPSADNLILTITKTVTVEVIPHLHEFLGKIKQLYLKHLNALPPEEAPVQVPPMEITPKKVEQQPTEEMLVEVPLPVATKVTRPAPPPVEEVPNLSEAVTVEQAGKSTALATFLKVASFIGLTVVGAGIGFMLGGPIGAVVGGIIGAGVGAVTVVDIGAVWSDIWGDQNTAPSTLPDNPDSSPELKGKVLEKDENPALGFSQKDDLYRPPQTQRSSKVDLRPEQIPKNKSEPGGK